MVSLSRKQTEAWWALEHPDVLEVFAGGGAGGGKSWLGCVWQIYRRTTYAGTRGFIGRENFTALRDSTMNTYFAVLQDMGLPSGEAWTYNAQEHTLTFANGSEQHFRHMSYMPSDPNYNRFGSTEYTDGFVDEAPEVDARASQVLLSRMRYRHTGRCTPALLYTGNPGEGWVKSSFVMDGDGNFIGLPAHRRRVLFTVADNPDSAIREGYARTLAHLDPYDRARLLYGDWTAKPNVERPFAFAFDEARHVKACAFRPGEPVRIVMDFNVEPLCASLWHVGQNYAHCFAEIAIKTGTLEAMQRRIREIIGNTALIELTGDHNGNNRGVGVNSTTSLFDGMRSLLRLSPRQLILKPNPSHLKSREDYNFILANFPDFRIDPSCTRMIADHRSVEVDDTGKIIKSDRSQAAQQADMLDTARYLVNTYLCDWITKHRNELSRHGALRERQRLPSDHRDLIHRVAGQWV